MKSDQPEIAALLAIAEAGKARPATSQSTALPLQGEDQP
jgi:hypothetical protein